MGLPIPGGFSDVEVRDFSALPTGFYSAKLVAAEWREANPDTKKNWEDKHPGEEHPGYVNWEYDISEEGFTDRKAWRNTALTPEGLGMLKESLLAFGETEEDLGNPDYVLEPEDHVGKDVRLSIGPDRKRPGEHKVRQVMPPADSELP